MYSFGDSTAFPLRDNFLDTLTSTVRCCAELFALECELDKAQQKIQQIDRGVAGELQRHESLEVALNLALGSAQGVLCSQTAKSLRATHLGILQRARQALVGERERLTREATPANVSSRVRQVLSTLWLKEELPKTQWSYRWRLDNEGKVKVDLQGQLRGVTASFVATPKSDCLWNHEIQVSSLLQSLELQIPVWSRRSKGTQTKKDDLAHYSIIDIESSQSRQRLLLRRSGKAKHALLITLADAAQSGPSISLVDEQQDVVGESHSISLPEREELQKLWSLVQEHKDSLVAARSELTNLRIDNRQLESFTHPSEIAEILLACIAPLAREIRLRSRVPGELILKRNTGKGRREELFLPRETLQALYEHLPERFQQVFDAMGLGQESTREFVTMLTDAHEATSTRQRSERVTGAPDTPHTPPAATAASLAIERTLAELTGGADLADEDDVNFGEPSIIVEFGLG